MKGKITDRSYILGVLFEFLQEEKDGGPESAVRPCSS